MSGKTVLSELLHSYIKTFTSYFPIYMIWEQEHHRNYWKWGDFVCSFSKALLTMDNLYVREDVILIVDEAQVSYNEPSFWVGFEKHQSALGNTSGLRLVMFSSFGSATSVALRIPGSAPITLEPQQRVSLTKQPHLPYCHGVGRDINVQCVLIKEMIIIVDHYTLAVRNRR
jgi:hypothetical protein